MPSVFAIDWLLDRYAGQRWELTNELDSSQRIHKDDNDWETDFLGYGRTFPHAWGDRDSKYFTTLSLTVAATHGSVWRYDRHVPIIFLGNGIKAGTVSRAVTPYDIAPTLSNILELEAPSGSGGELLPEVTR